MTVKRVAFALALALAFAFVTPANSAPLSVQVLRTDDVLVKPGFNIEYAAVATPDSKNPKCPDRRLMVDTYYYFFGIDLNQGGPAVWMQKELSDHLAPKDGINQNYTPFGSGGGPKSGDPSMVRRQNGDVIVSIASNIDSTPTGGTPVDRGFQRFWVSHDCGGTWSNFGFIDAASVPGLTPADKCSAPRWDKDDITKMSPGGWDRAEFYDDPWTDTLFMTASCFYGKPDDATGKHVGGDNSEAELFRYDDASGHWMWAQTLPIGAPYVMTSTQGGLWVFMCEKNNPEVYHFNPDGSGKTGPVKVGSDSCIGQASANLYPADVNPQNSTGLANDSVFRGPGRDLGIARAPGADSIRVAFPTVEHPNSTTLAENRSVLAFAGASFDGTIHAITSHTPHIKAKKPDASIIMTTFVERTDPELGGTATALLYWLESDPDSDSTQVGYAMALKGGKLGAVHHIGNHPVRYLFKGGNGDFINGAYYCERDGGAEHFIGLFPAGDETPDTGQGTGAAAPNGDSLDAANAVSIVNNGEVGLHMFELKVNERCHGAKANASPHLNLKAPSQAAPVNGPVPTVAPIGPTTSVTSHATTTATTHPSTTTHPTSSTSLHPYAVRRVELTVDTCSLENDRKWHCPAEARFTFDPGRGGPLSWHVHGKEVEACDVGATDFDEPMRDAHVADGQSQIVADGDLTFDDAPNPELVDGDRGRPSFAIASAGGQDSSLVNFYSDTECGKP